MRDGVLPAVRMRSRGIERTGGSCASVGKDTAEIIDVGVDGYLERPNGDKAVQYVSVSQETPLLGQSFLGEGLLR